MNPSTTLLLPYAMYLIGCDCTLLKMPDQPITKITGIYINGTILIDPITNMMPAIVSIDDIKPHLRRLEDIREEELLDIAMGVLNVSPHMAYLATDEIKKFLIDNTTFIIGNIPDEENTVPPLEEYEFTPQTFFNLSHYLLTNHFDLYGLIEANLAIEITLD